MCQGSCLVSGSLLRDRKRGRDSSKDRLRCRYLIDITTMLVLQVVQHAAGWRREGCLQDIQLSLASVWASSSTLHCHLVTDQIGSHMRCRSCRWTVGDVSHNSMRSKL